jgi:hypothetical protein
MPSMDVQLSFMFIQKERIDVKSDSFEILQ